MSEFHEVDRCFPSGNFPRVSSQMATGNFSNVQFPKRQLLISVLAADGNISNVQFPKPQPRRTDLIFCEIAHFGSCHLGNRHLESDFWENAFGKIPYSGRNPTVFQP